jgi:regulator of sigma E protease
MSPVILFIGAVASLIFVHELGHFLAAKFRGVRVDEFGFGFPPRIVKLFKFGETDITLNWIPFGGFVRTAGENDPDVEGGLAAANPWSRIIVLLAGPAMNFLAALLLFAFVFVQLGKPDFNTVIIQEIANSSPAQEAGLQRGDIVQNIAGQDINSSQELRDQIYANLGSEIEIVVERNGQLVATSLIPRDPPPEEGAIGILMGNPTLPVSGLEAIGFSAAAIGDQVNALISLPGKLVSGEISADQGRLVGYKGMYDIFTEVRAADTPVNTESSGAINTLAFFASISISLGLLNLLPIPALDGGRILFTLPEILFKRRIPSSYENMINFVGFAILIMLMIYVNIQDFVNPINIP